MVSLQTHAFALKGCLQGCHFADLLSNWTIIQITKHTKQALIVCSPSSCTLCLHYFLSLPYARACVLVISCYSGPPEALPRTIRQIELKTENQNKIGEWAHEMRVLSIVRSCHLLMWQSVHILPSLLQYPHKNLKCFYAVGWTNELKWCRLNYRFSILGVTWQVSKMKIPLHSCWHASFHACLVSSGYVLAIAPFTSSKGPCRAITAHYWLEVLPLFHGVIPTRCCVSGYSRGCTFGSLK